LAWRKVAPKLLTAIPAGAIHVSGHDATTVKITSIDSEVFRILQKYFHKTGTEFFTHPLREDRPLKVVIKGLTSDITETEITEELKDKGYEVKQVRQFGNSAKKLPIYLVILSSNPTNKLIFDEHSMFFMSVKVESYRANSPAQCFSCQRFGHSSLYCGYPPRCVKCAGSHLAKDCSKLREADPKCVNCEGTHTANYSKCPALLQEIAKRRPIRPNTMFLPSQPRQVPPSTDTPLLPSLHSDPSTKSYASATSNGRAMHSNLKKVITQLTELIPNLISGKIEIKDALITLLTILPLLLNNHA